MNSKQTGEMMADKALDALEVQSKVVEAMVREKGAACEELRKEIASKGNQLKVLWQDLACKEAECENLRKEIASEEEELKNMNHNLATKRDQLNDLEKRGGSLKTVLMEKKNKKAHQDEQFKPKKISNETGMKTDEHKENIHDEKAFRGLEDFVESKNHNDLDEQEKNNTSDVNDSNKGNAVTNAGQESLTKEVEVVVAGGEYATEDCDGVGLDESQIPKKVMEKEEKEGEPAIEPVLPRRRSPRRASADFSNNLALKKVDSPMAVSKRALPESEIQPLSLKKTRHENCFCDEVGVHASYRETTQEPTGVGALNWVACDAEDCRVAWFHLQCVGLKVVPEGAWFCEDCQEKRNVIGPS